MRLCLVWLLCEEARGSWLTSDVWRVTITAERSFARTFGLTWAPLSGCCGRRLYADASGRESGLLTVASPLLTAPNSPPAETVRRRRAGCGNGLQHTNTRLFIHVQFWLQRYVAFIHFQVFRLVRIEKIFLILLKPLAPVMSS